MLGDDAAKTLDVLQRTTHEDGIGHALAVVGAPAHVTLVDATVRVTVDPAKQWTRSTNCPFRGMELPGQVRYTIYGGVPTVVDATPIAKEDR